MQINRAANDRSQDIDVTYIKHPYFNSGMQLIL